jgi:gluconokinase
MGVSGCGKTTVAARLAARLGWPMAEGDAFHSAANVEKMRSGIPLTDADRWPWLDAIAAWIERTRAQGGHGVVACSALKRAYRERLVAGHDDVRIAYLQGDYDTIAKRLAARPHHYMPATLLRSQFEALEEPGPEERPVIVSIEASPEEIARRILTQLGVAS